MEQPIQFRSAFNGFNREDVVHYMEYVNNRHSAQVAELSNELEYLRSKQTSMSGDRIASLESQLTAAQAENQSLKEKIEQLEQQLKVAGTQKPQPMLELEAYRRAERAERVAKERARQISQQTSNALKDASGQMDDAAGQLAQIAGQLTEQLHQLQSTMELGHHAFENAYAKMDALNSEME